MPNVGGPKQERRALLSSVVTSVITYGAAIWADKLDKYKECLRKVSSVYRLSALRVASAFRTVSGDAVEVIAGMAPIKEITQERKRLYLRKKEGDTDMEKAKSEEQQVSLERWQEAWDQSEKGRWTHRLIPEVGKWVNRSHGRVNYYLTQMLSGHGCFREYLHKYKHEDSPECRTCSNTDETAEHVFFQCPRFAYFRSELEAQINQRVTPETIFRAMLESEDAWNAASHFATKVLKELCREEERERVQNKVQKGNEANQEYNVDGQEEDSKGEIEDQEDNVDDEEEYSEGEIDDQEDDVPGA